MKKFFKTIWRGFQAISISVFAIALFATVPFLFNILLSSVGFEAVTTFVLMIVLFICGVGIMYLLGANFGVDK